MCFSAEADLVTGAVVAVAGVDAFRHVRHPRELALAGLPGLLAAHQLTEVFVWSGLEDRIPPVGAGTAIILYALVAFVVLPAYVPWAVRAVEPAYERRRLMLPFALLGVLVAVVYAVAMGERPVVASIEGNRIAYDTGLSYGGALSALYILAACAPLLVSSHRRIVVFGAWNVLAVAALVWLAQDGLTSLWCAWAAVTSIVIARHLRVAHEPGAPAHESGAPAREADAPPAAGHEIHP
ncbi:MAG: hypothetical protein LC799_26260 [Actinobacteria bacterium]|nr:hypothetical protein [Actinomycetota bacterium]